MQEITMTSPVWCLFVSAGLTLLAMLHWTSRRAHSSLNTSTLCRNVPAANAPHWHDGCANLSVPIPTTGTTHSVRMQQSMTCSKRQLMGLDDCKICIYFQMDKIAKGESRCPRLLGEFGQRNWLLEANTKAKWRTTTGQ